MWTADGTSRVLFDYLDVAGLFWGRVWSNGTGAPSVVEPPPGLGGCRQTHASVGSSEGGLPLSEYSSQLLGPLGLPARQSGARSQEVRWPLMVAQPMDPCFAAKRPWAGLPVGRPGVFGSASVNKTAAKRRSRPESCRASDPCQRRESGRGRCCSNGSGIVLLNHAHYISEWSVSVLFLRG